MKFLPIAQNRYSTKKFDPSEKISLDQIDELKEILRLSPSSINSQPWKFSFIETEEIKNALAKASFYNESKIIEASHLVVFNVIDDLDLFEKQITDNLPDSALGYYMDILKPQSKKQIDSWLSHQVYLALGTFLSACAVMGIDATPMEGIDGDKYAKILRTKGYKILFAVAIGYRSEDDKNQPSIKPKSRLKLHEVVEVV